MSQKKITYHNIRLRSESYRKLKQRAKKNNRPLSSELALIIDESIDRDEQIPGRFNGLMQLSGIVKNLPPDHYGRKVDEILYGE